MSALDPRQRDLVKCEDMRLHSERARKYIGAMTLEEFAADDLVQSAVVRCIEIVGEAARMISASTRERAPQIPWSSIVGMRHVLAHHYGAVDLEKVYHVAVTELARLGPKLAQLIADLERELGWQDRGN